MIKRVLVPLDPSKYCETAMEYACIIGKRFDAEVTGIAVLDIPAIESSIGAVPLGAMQYAERLEKKKKEEALNIIKQLLEKFAQKCEKEGVNHKEAEFQGHPSKQIALRSTFYDMVVVGLRTFYRFETQEGADNSLEDMMDNSASPFLAVPENYKDIEKKDVLLAFDGSVRAGRALQHFANLASAKKYNVLILMSHKSEEHSRYFLEQAKTYLSCYGFEDIRTSWTKEDITDVVKANYYDWADMFVCGAHSKRFADFLLGSFSKYLIKKAEKPVLIG